MSRIVYYAHPMSWYGTESERLDLEELHSYFGNQCVINPAGVTEAELRIFLQRNPDMTKMDYFINLVRAADGLAYRKFKDGRLGAGVGAELYTAVAAGKTIWRIGHGSELYLDPAPFVPAPLTIEETRARVKAGKL